MSLIAGFVAFERGRPPLAPCARMLEALRPFRCSRNDLREVAQAAFGRALQFQLPEDEFDDQPVSVLGGAGLLVADARIDNRDEVEAQLGISASRAATLSDAGLLASAWDRWGAGLFRHVLGDVALAAWDPAASELLLARSPMALKPLYYSIGRDFLAFASVPDALHAVVPKRLALEQAAAIASLDSNLLGGTIYQDISAVRHGSAVHLRGHSIRRDELWRPRRAVVRNRCPSDYAEGLREELDRAVRARLRRHQGNVAAHLSAGRDSAAVATSAARALASSNAQLLAVTAAPRSGFSGPVPAGLLADESPLAAQIAASDLNIKHKICRTRPMDVGACMASLHQLHHGPLLNPSNLVWSVQTSEAAADAGASVLLTGWSGNFALSAGGVEQLRDLFIEEGPKAWFGTSSDWAGASARRWLTVANVTFGPLLPRSVYHSLIRARGGSALAGYSVETLREPYRRAAADRLASLHADPRPANSSGEYRGDLLLRRDNPELFTMARWAVEPRDPTSDRRLIDYCWTLPSSQLVSGPLSRPAFEAAFQDRIPAPALHNQFRGYQTADWFEHFTQDAVRDAFGKHRKNEIVAELFDFEHIDRLLDAWPNQDWSSRLALHSYRSVLLGSLAVANFIEVKFPN